MKNIILAAAVSLLCANFVVANAATPKQEKMKACNAEAGDKKGDERKQFMKECLSAKKTEKADEKSAKTPQQEKMKACNKDAGEKKLKGDERKKFMSECLKG